MADRIASPLVTSSPSTPPPPPYVPTTATVTDHHLDPHIDESHTHTQTHPSPSNIDAPLSSSSSSSDPDAPSPLFTAAANHELRWSSSEMELSNHHRIMSAGIGAFLTSLVVTPFDVVKTRLQAQINFVNPPFESPPRPTPPPAQACAPRPTASQLLLQDCSHYRIHTGLMDSWCNNCFSKAGTVTPAASSFVSTTPELRFTGAIDAAAKLIKHEGLASLWRGLSPTILMSIPSTVVYFSMYDKVKIALAAATPHDIDRYLPGYGQYTHQLRVLSPLFAGVFARALTTTLVSPIELVRTKSQSLRTSTSMTSLLVSELKHGGPLSLWRGVGPTLMRDVPFSAVYWSSYEYSKRYLLDHWSATRPHQESKTSWIYASFLAGAGSGMLAAGITHPFDLIKTRRQIELYKNDAIIMQHTAHSAACTHTVPNATATPATSIPTVNPSTTWAVCKTIVAEEGYVGLLSGLSARMTKIAPACAIMISTYEASKMVFGEQTRNNAH